MSDKDIVEALIAHDERVTRHFFFEKCRPLFLSIIHKVFPYEVDYEELINELYVFLMESDARRLRTYEERSSIYQWLKTTAIRFFLSRRMVMIENQPLEPLYEDCDLPSDEKEQQMVAKIDIDNLLSKMDNRRYAFVIQQLVIEDKQPADVAEILGVSVDNLYNIKKRAIAALTALALKETRS